MIDVLMLYCFSVAALVSVAAYAGERVVAALGLPRRAVWIGALVISLCLPLFMIATSDPIATPTIATPVAAIEIAAIVDSAPLAEMPLELPSVATMLKGLWMLGSGGLLVFAFAGWMRLRMAAKKWTSEQVEGVEVQVAENLGPAVFGFINPQIVVPRWLLDAPAADRNAALAHERSHIAAGDTRLLLLGLLLIVMTPWNLPMWWQLRRLRFAIEVDCDQRVLRGGTSMATYGEMLLAVGQRSSRTPIGAIALTEPTSQLERRIRIMTKGTLQPIKALMLVFLAMSVSLVAVAAQLDAPPLSGIAPNMFASKVADVPAPNTEISAAQLPTESSAKDSKPSSEAISPKVGAVPASHVKRLAMAIPTAKSAVAKSVAGEFVYRAERVDGDGILHDVVVQRRVGEKVEFAKAPRATLRGAGPGQQMLTLYDGERFEEGPGSSNSRERFPEASLLVRAPAEATTKLALAADKAEPAPASKQQSTAMDSKLKRVYTVAPIFPDSALQAGIYDGYVEVAFTVAVTGDVQKEAVKKSEPVGVFDESALTAVRQWRFEPAVKDGVPQETRTLIRLKFSRPSSGYLSTGVPYSNSTAATLIPHAGERLTLKFIDIDVRTVLKLLADSSGQNILISDKVSGTITLQLSSVPWDEALDLIVREKGLVKRQTGGVILIEPGTASPVL